MVKSVTVPTASLYPDADSTRESPARHKTGDHRNAFRRDLARLVHSPSFRRLQGKTQLFPSHENDFYRNRLTHSIEVAQIATGIATNLNGRSYFKSDPIDISLVTFAALAHDIGHPPFGHNGERVLDHLMLNHGGFEGNAQTLRILSRLEKKETTTFPAQTKTFTVATETEDLRLGLNLTHRTLASIIKYYSKIPKSKERRLGRSPRKGILLRRS
jgi:dGTPase